MCVGGGSKLGDACVFLLFVSFFFQDGIVAAPLFRSAPGLDMVASIIGLVGGAHPKPLTWMPKTPHLDALQAFMETIHELQVEHDLAQEGSGADVFHLRVMMDLIRIHHIQANTPLEYVCPLTHSVMTDPVLLAETGHSYDRVSSLLTPVHTHTHQHTPPRLLVHQHTSTPRLLEHQYTHQPTPP